MKTIIRKVLAAKTAILAAMALMICAVPAHAGIPVIDGANLVQTVVSAISDVAMEAEQVSQYATQLQQYQNQLQNTLAPAEQIWQQAQQTMNNLNGAINTLATLKSKYGSVAAYTSNFKSADLYMANSCFTAAGCSKSAFATMQGSQTVGSQSQQAATAALFQGLDQQQQALISDSNTLQSLQSAAQGAQGQLDAIGYATQFASHQATQLLQIRALLVAQQNAIATRNQALQDTEAKQQAAAVQVRIGTFTASPATSY